MKRHKHGFALIELLMAVTIMLQSACVQTKRHSGVIWCPTFAAGDTLVIEFGNDSTMVWTQEVRGDGTIVLPLNQKVRVTDKDVSSLETAIHEIYVPRCFRELTVKIRTAPPTFFITGEVRKPCQKEHSEEMTVMTAITAAGGFTDYADKWIDVVRANGEVEKVDGTAVLKGQAKDVPVYPGDRVHVNRRRYSD